MATRRFRNRPVRYIHYGRSRPRHHSGLSQMHENLIAGGVGTALGLAQFFSKDGSTISSASSPAKAAANSLVGRIFGINPFNDQPQFPATRNWAGILNPGVALGAIPLVYGVIAPRGSPGKRLAVKTGAVSMVLAAIFGFFDAPSDRSPNQRHIAPAANNSSSNMLAPS